MCKFTGILLMKKMVLTLLFSLLFTSVANASDPFREVDGTVRNLDAIMHNNNRVVIDDRIYQMSLGLKVYKYNRSTKNLETVNRYALKEGMDVVLAASFKQGRYYVDTIIYYQ